MKAVADEATEEGPWRVEMIPYLPELHTTNGNEDIPTLLPLESVLPTEE